MRATIAAVVAMSLSVPALSFAYTCPATSPPTIDAPAADAAKCLSAVAKSSSKFVSSKMKTMDKCRKARVPGSCVDTTPAAFASETRDQKSTDKIVKAANKAADGIAKKCSQANVDGLGTSYASVASSEQMASCILSQHNAISAIMSWNNNGASAPWPASADEKARTKCVDQLAKGATKMVQGWLKTINKCVDTEIKNGATVDIQNACIGGLSGSTPPGATDTKTNEKLVKSIDKFEATIDKHCGALSAEEIVSIFACPDAGDAAGLKDCGVCTNWSMMMDLLAQQYSETGTFIADAGAGNIGVLQSAWDGASDGQRFLIESGTYTSDPGDGGTDDAVIQGIQTGTCNGGDTPGAQCSNVGDCPGAAISCDGASPVGVEMIGCGGATGDRPKIQPDTALNTHNRGINMLNVDGFVMQSLEASAWEGDALFVSGAEGAVFRDIYGDGDRGGDFETVYVVFPVDSDDVMVEGCFTTNVRDAAIYVGSSTNYTIRYNQVTDSVAGIEVENSINARSHNNESYSNTGGLLVFMLTGKSLAASFDHETDHNVLVANNTPNFGFGTVGEVPDGTGMLAIATDTSTFHHNYIADNNSMGIGVIDQLILSVISGDGGDCCTSACISGGVKTGIPCNDNADCATGDTCEAVFRSLTNSYEDNVLSLNGASLDPDLVGIVPDNSQNVLIISGPADHNNCFEDNTLILPPAVDPMDAESFAPSNDCVP